MLKHLKLHSLRSLPLQVHSQSRYGCISYLDFEKLAREIETSPYAERAQYENHCSIWVKSGCIDCVRG
jgi:hypothetical protein